MILRSLFVLIFGALGLALAGSPAVATDTDVLHASEGELLFARSVGPLLQQKCHACHGKDKEDLRGELNLLSRETALEPAASGLAALVPDHPEDSPLYQAATRTGDWSPMPPKDNDALTDQQLSQLKRWISVGAPWPSEERIKAIKAYYEESWNSGDGAQVATSGGLQSDWTDRRYQTENLWAFEPLWRDTDKKFGSDSNSLDTFINEHLAELKLNAAPLADRRTLIRRATFDLLGLPPTPAEVAAFLNDPVDDLEAFTKLVDRLLASPHYGEKWGQHWLDITRYADSSGFANDYERGNAWRYRDYVVRCFNEDKPYDQFIKQQLAGDEIDPTDPENLIAVGFLRMGPWELSTMEVPKVARQRFLDDATASIGQVFLGQMLQCASCHDHKFDPIPTRDYYSIQANLATTQLAERRADFLPEENIADRGETGLIERRAEFYRKQLARLNEVSVAAARKWLVAKNLDPQGFEKQLLSSNGDFEAARAAMQRAGVAALEIPPRHIGFEPTHFGVERIARKGLERLKWQAERTEPFALSVYNGYTPEVTTVTAPVRIPNDRFAGQLEAPAILTGGSPFSPAGLVRPGVLSAVVGIASHTANGENVLPVSAVSFFAGKVPVEDFDSIPVEGRRSALAEWIASEDNPLTARVMVNRIWQGHFGRGIAGNPNNFGSTGKKPTHPHLLDWLATQFIESGWSVKHMHRLIMLSEAYRRSSIHPAPDKLQEADPLGESYAVFLPRRLTAEEIRDSLLLVSGELNQEVGGLPVRPEINLEVALQPRMVMGTFAEAWQPSRLPQERHRRSIYTLKLRGLRDPFFEVFNSPSPDLSTERRDTSTVSPQVFTLFNSQAAHLRALALANRLDSEVKPVGDDSRREKIIEQAFNLAYNRPPEAEETAACLQHWQAMKLRHEKIHLDWVSYPSEVVREAVDENTGEKFVFVEPLEEFVPDLLPQDVSSDLRGLAEVCLVIFNSNEFLYVY